MTTICYLGNFEHAFWSTENHVKASLEELGALVVPIQEDTTDASQVSQIVKHAKPQLFMWTRTWGIPGDGFAMLREMECPSVAFHLDLYAGLERSSTLTTEPWWTSTHVFTADGGSDGFWKEHGVNHHWSPPAVYGRECYLAEPNPEWQCEILFTGSYGYHREWQYRPLLIDKLREQYGDRFKLVEHGSPGAPWRGDKLNRLYASAKVVVGDSCNVNPLFHHKKYWSDRAPETLGRSNTLLIHPYVSGMDNFYKDREHLVYYEYNDWNGLFSKVDYYLKHEEERVAIGNRGHLFVKNSQTYLRRMENVIDVVLNGKKSIY